MSAKIKISVDTRKCRLHGKTKTLLKIQKRFKVRNPNAFFIRKRGNVRDWDGKINYITDSFYFKTGLLDDVIEYIETELGKKVKLYDQRDELGIKPKLPKKVGDKKPRKYQIKAASSIVHNEVKGLNVPMGVIDAATNAGKTMICAMIYLAYKRKIPALVLINDGDLYEQFKTEIPQLVGDDAGFVRGKQKDWNNFTVAMVQTLSRDINKYKRALHQFGIVLVDEADLADNKSYKNILDNLPYAVIRCGLSGTIYMSKLAKHKPKNMNLRSYFGPVRFKITKKEMVDKGYSTNIIIKVHKGNTMPVFKGYMEQYNRCIVYNEDRNNKILERVRFNAKIGRTPMVVICRLHDHVDLLYRMISLKMKGYKVEQVHHSNPNRKQIIQDFRDGKIDILVSSLILTRGKNFPLLRVFINAAAGDSQERVSQLMGRLERKHESKDKAIMEDFYDEGNYFNRHSKHRVIYYKKEKFKVIQKY